MWLLNNSNPLCQNSQSIRGKYQSPSKYIIVMLKESSESFISFLGNLEEMLHLGDFVHLLVLRLNKAISEAIFLLFYLHMIL